jgi:hypothetical protein
MGGGRQRRTALPAAPTTEGAEESVIALEQLGTVRPGRNRLRFRVECFGVPIAAAEILGSTPLRETEQCPARLRLTAPDAVRDPEAGTALPVTEPGQSGEG